MTKRTNISGCRNALFAAILCVAALVGVAGCDDDPTTAVVDNAFPMRADAGSGARTSVFKVWWGTTLFASPVAPGARSAVERTVPATAFAYALLAPGWSPEDGGRPGRLVPVRSAAKLSVAAHDLLRIGVSDDTFVGDCAAGKPLDADEAQLIVERIFPDEFAGVVYDPATCATTDASPTTDGGAADGGDALDD